MSYVPQIKTATEPSSSFTCITCSIRLSSLAIQQQHHKSDWHTYNLKRKVVWLPPVSAEAFQLLVQTSRENSNPVEQEQPECLPCGKKYLSFQALENHEQSKKHKQIVQALAKKTPIVTTTKENNKNDTVSDNDEPVTKVPSVKNLDRPLELEPSSVICLFCRNHEELTVEENYHHMKTKHGFFIPSIERLIDLEGILDYLADKLMKDFDCLWCTPSVFNRQISADQELQTGFSSLANVRRHMVDKGHCKVLMENGAEVEYSDFYVSLEDIENEEEHDHDHHDHHQHDGKEGQDDNADGDDEKTTLVQDENGDWVLKESSGENATYRLDPKTNELVLLTGSLRLGSKESVRKQKIDSRAVTLIPSSSRRPQTATGTGEDGEQESGDENNKQVLIGSAAGLQTRQLNQVAKMEANGNDFVAKKKEYARTKMGLDANHYGRRRYNGVYGTKV